MKRAQFAVPGFLAALMAMADPALAKPTYLTCVTVENGSSERIDITADEDTGMVSIFVPRTGASQSYRAAFSRDQVTFSDRVNFDYSISRTNLSIAIARWSGSIAKGKCQVAPPPKRAF